MVDWLSPDHDMVHLCYKFEENGAQHIVNQQITHLIEISSRRGSGLARHIIVSSSMRLFHGAELIRTCRNLFTTTRHSKIEVPSCQWMDEALETLTAFSLCHEKLIIKDTDSLSRYYEDVDKLVMTQGSQLSQ